MTEACLRVGIHMLAIEIDTYQSAHYMTNPRTVDDLMEAVGRHDIKYAHFATPCNSFSIARWPKLRTRQFPMGIPGLQGNDQLLVLKSNACVDNSFDAIEQLTAKNIAWSVEIPASSLL